MVEFEVKEIVEVLLVAILGIVILFFVVGGGGRMGPLWDKFCEWMPQLCGGGEDSIDYEMSEKSAQAITAAINAVIKGEKDYPGLSSFKPSSAPAGGIGIAGLQTAPADATKIEVKTTVTCEDGDIQKLGEIEFVAGTESQAEDYCKSTCEEDCDASVNKKGDIAYHVSQKEKTVVRCDCYCKENSLPDSPATNEGSFMGLTGQVAGSKCGQKCGAKWPEAKNCRNIDVDLSKTNEESTKLYNEILQKDVEIVTGVLKQCICKNKNDVNDQYYAYVGPGEYEWKDWELCALWSNYEYEDGSCSELNGRLLLYKDDDFTPQVRSISRFGCEKTTPTIECIVHDFKLPQKVGDVQTYVINYGDPKFLYYWNEFPIEENSWTFKPDWKVHALIGIVTLLPPTKVAGVGIKMGWAAIKKGGGNLVKRAFKRATGREMVQMTLPGMKAAVKPAVAKVFSWALLREELEQIIKKRFTLPGVKRMAIKGVFLETAYHAAIMADSMSENYKPHNNNMVLKSPYEDAELLSLEDGWEKRPVLVKWRRKPTVLHGTDLATAHLVSPCYLSEVNVKKMSIRCKDYTFDSEQKSTTCTGAKTKDSGKDDITCGVFDEIIDKYLEYDGIYDKVTAFLKMSDRKIFEHEPFAKTPDGDDIMKIKKIYLPHKLLETGEIHYITDFELIENDKIIKNPCNPQTKFCYNIYSAKLHHGDTEEIVEMKCRKGVSCEYTESLCVIRNDKVSEKPFEYMIIEERDETGFFHSEKIATEECDLWGVRIVFGDGDEDGNWDSIEANSDDDSIILSEIDISGNFKNIGTSERFPAVFGDTGKGCYITGIVIDLTNPDLVDRQKATGITGNDNYCVWHVSKFEAWKGDIADALTIIGYGVALYFGGPVGVFIVAATSGFQVYTEISADYRGAWP